MTSTFAGLVQQDTATPEQFVRAFANEYPTPNVKRGLALCISGALSWAAVAEVCHHALAAAVKEVAA